MAWIAPIPTLNISAAAPYSEFLDWDRSDLDEDVTEHVSRLDLTHLCMPTNWAASNTQKITESEFPSELKIKNPYKHLGDLILVPPRFLVVQQPLRDLLEEFEPRIHQFWPISVELHDGSRPDNQFYGLRVRQACRSVDFANSELTVHSEGPSDPNATHLPYVNPDFLANKWKVFIRRDDKRTEHLWVDWIGHHHVMISDMLRNAIRKRDLKVFRLFRVKEI